MKIRILLLSLLAGASLAASADAPSPARAQMNGFIAAFNSGDRSKIETFGRAHMPPDFMRAAVIDHTVRMFQTTGGFDVLDVTESSPLALRGHVRERLTKTVQQMTVEVDAAAPERITQIWFRTPDEPANAAPH